MALLHAFRSQGLDDGNLDTEIYDLSLDSFCDLENAWHLFVSELSENHVHSLLGSFDELLDVGTVDIFKGVIQDGVMLLVPFFDSGPEFVVGLEVFDGLSDRSVVSLLIGSN
jgi:hypothetical protein